MFKNDKNNTLPGFIEFIHAPVIISNTSKLSEILYINKAGKELADEIFTTTSDLISQANCFSGLFRNIINYNKLDSIYKSVLKKNINLDDVFITFTGLNNRLYSMLLKISLIHDENNNKIILTSINNISEISVTVLTLLFKKIPRRLH
jgi:hypothetical protein